MTKIDVAFFIVKVVVSGSPLINLFLNGNKCPVFNVNEVKTAVNVAL